MQSSILSDLTDSEISENYGKLKPRWLGLETKLRSLLALPAEDRHQQEIKLLKYLGRLGLIDETASLDDILNLKIEHLLERRLQTMIMRKIDTKSPYTARQIVVHGHVSIGDRFVNLPGHIVRKEEENQLLVHVELSKPSTSTTSVPNVEK